MSASYAKGTQLKPSTSVFREDQFNIPPKTRVKNDPHKYKLIFFSICLRKEHNSIIKKPPFSSFSFSSTESRVATKGEVVVEAPGGQYDG